MKGIWSVIQKLGILLTALSFLFLVGTELISAGNRAAAEDLAIQIEELLPRRSEGDPANYSDPAMPSLEIDGEDFCGLLKVPSFGVTLPLHSSWDNASAAKYPCRFWGSVYDNSLIVGGSGGKGQLDFCNKLDLGDKIRITDMTGTEFTYETVRIDRRKHADMQTFEEMDSDLVLFAPEGNSGGYIIVRCDLSN